MMNKYSSRQLNFQKTSDYSEARAYTMAGDLLDSDDGSSDDEPGVTDLRISNDLPRNEEYARRFEHNKRREEMKRRMLTIKKN